jgi:Ca2+-binding RTX toxin-like protein
MDPVLNQTTGTSHATLSDAIANSSSGDVLVLAPGSYVEDFPDITHSLTIRCDAGMASLTRATPLTVDGRAILNVPGYLGVDLTVIGLEISGAKRPGADPNGAAILHEFGNGNLTIERCYIHGNENGILVGGTKSTSPPGGVNVVIRDSEFANNGAPPGSAYAAGGKCHNIYVNDATSLLIEDSYIHSVFSQGHQIKSRAQFNTIINNRIEDLPQVATTTYGSSYSIDISDGGVAVIRGNTIEKGPYSRNKYIIAYAAEGERWPDNTLLVEDNHFVNGRPDGATLLLTRYDTATDSGIPIVFTQNSFEGPYAFAFAGDIYIGAASNDTLHGTAGADSMIGGLGDDEFLVNDPGDAIAETAGGGTDTVRTTRASFLLPAEFENLAFVGAGDFAGTGNAAANALAGGDGADTLDGGAGADTMTGGSGNDLYRVNEIGDQVIEAADGGADTVIAPIAWTLAAHVEDLILTGTAGLAATGNAEANRMVGNTGSNRLTGLAGNDTLDGGASNDTLDGGSGADSLAGGSGNDLYILDDAGDAALEAPGGGADTVTTTLDTYVLPAEIELLVFTGAGGFAGTGNALANRIAGGSGNDSLAGEAGADSLWGANGADTLDGGSGADTMNGGAGDDTYRVDSTLDRVTELTGGGFDTVLTTLGAMTLPGYAEALVFAGSGDFAGTGTSLANLLTGGDGADTLNGAAGADTLQGGGGDDTYVVDSLLDSVAELPGGGTDTVRTLLRDYTLGAELENLAYTSTLSFRGVGNMLANRITGGIGADTLDGGAGADTLTGGAGNDVYDVDAAGDLILEAPGGGADLLRTTLAAYGLGALPDIEHLSFIGTGGFAGTGNGAANRILGAAGDDSLAGEAANDTLGGGDGADTLDGGLGADSMAGGLGDDTYLVDSLADIVLEGLATGFDTVRTTLGALTLANYVEALVFTGTGGFAGTGNTLANALTGGDGADTLNGATGADTLTGGLGDDTYVVDNALDSVAESPGGGLDTVRSTLTVVTLAAELENLVCITLSSFRGTGNTLANVIAGNNGADTLDGAGGADTLAGGTGNDTFRFVAGEADGDAITDFNGNGALIGDRLLFVGFGLAAAGAQFLPVSATDWMAIAADGLTTATIRFANAAAVHATDVVFA